MLHLKDTVPEVIFVVWASRSNTPTFFCLDAGRRVIVQAGSFVLGNRVYSEGLFMPNCKVINTARTLGFLDRFDVNAIAVRLLRVG